jgi:epsin
MVTGFNQNTPGLQNLPSFQSQNLQVPGATQFQTSMTTGTNPFSQMNQPQQQQQQPLQPQQHDYSGLVFGQPQQEPEKPQFTSSPVFATAGTSRSFSFTQQSSPVPSSSPAIRANTFPSPQVNDQ